MLYKAVNSNFDFEMLPGDLTENELEEQMIAMMPKLLFATQMTNGEIKKESSAHYKQIRNLDEKNLLDALLHAQFKQANEEQLLAKISTIFCKRELITGDAVTPDEDSEAITQLDPTHY